jgi:hypothetical protein
MQDKTERGRKGYGGKGWFEHEDYLDDELPDEEDKQDDGVSGGEATDGGMSDGEEQDEGKKEVDGETSDEDDAGIDSDANGLDETAGDDYSQYEDFADVLKLSEKCNKQNKLYANHELDDVRAKIFLERVNIDLEAAKKEILKFLQYRRQQYDRLDKMPPEKASTWILEKEVHDRGLALHQRLTLQAAGVNGDLLSGIMDDYAHLQEDALDPDGRELRNELKEQMKMLRRDEREELLAQMLQNKTIDDTQYHYLRNEFC